MLLSLWYPSASSIGWEKKKETIQPSESERIDFGSQALRSSCVKLDRLLSFSRSSPVVRWDREVLCPGLSWVGASSLFGDANYCRGASKKANLSLFYLASSLHRSIYWRVPVSLLTVSLFSQPWTSKKRHKGRCVLPCLARLAGPSRIRRDYICSSQVQHFLLLASSSPQQTLSISSW